jgi:hypothetical protein
MGAHATATQETSSLTCREEWRPEDINTLFKPPECTHDAKSAVLVGLFCFFFRSNAIDTLIALFQKMEKKRKNLG